MFVMTHILLFWAKNLKKQFDYFNAREVFVDIHNQA